MLVPYSPDGQGPPFCSTHGHGNHHVSSYDACEECGRGNLINDDSDHMWTRLKGLVVLCGACAKMYKEVWELSQMTGISE